MRIYNMMNEFDEKSDFHINHDIFNDFSRYKPSYFLLLLSKVWALCDFYAHVGKKGEPLRVWTDCVV